jgi:hypothetical protein
MAFTFSSSLKLASLFNASNAHVYSPHNLLSSNLSSLFSQTIVFIAGKEFVNNPSNFFEMSCEILTVRSASFPISKESNLSKSFLVLVGTEAFDKATQVGILFVVSLEFRFSFLMSIFFRISIAFFQCVAHSFQFR